MSQKYSVLSSTQSVQTVDGSLNVLIHGLFFMEVNAAKQLEVFAPVVNNPHDYLGGVRGRLADLSTLTGPIDWTTDPNLTGKAGDPDPMNDVRAPILKFSRTATNVGNFKPKDSKRTIILPWPKAFFPLRLAKFSDFTFLRPPRSTGVVGGNILSLCGRGGTNDSLSVVTGLSYDYKFAYPPVPSVPPWKPNLNFHFYLNPVLGHDIRDVNRDLRDVRQIFTNGQAFDLQMDESAAYPSTPLDLPDILPDGINVEDELSLDEPVTTPLHSTVLRQLTLILQSKAMTDKNRRDLLDPLDPMVSPANCPNFFVLG